ncbi:uncharacterized protein K460DRAFT_366885 [Cucurbitaria berberidis CBS 394.84]|uniref:Uncharacterized protein n=1 Tax=Cucurbitaria berberidis CBS 394.84 TaxID=1168544 RepID=A0A9P4GIV8_9PLEO|nr:uncharacterized protein K460DRAFT_366885 [Cucurbitaria berberidis CBS 394.84]KAF1846039.1 hypothetical protein K460DRAFT_366885 [Cucurbitaria berberidis CBS 394.84]
MSHMCTDAIWGAVVQTLDRAQETAQQVGDKETDKATASMTNRQIKDEAEPERPEKATQQSVFERHPDRVHRSIDEVLEDTKTLEEQVKLKERSEDLTAEKLTTMIQETLHVGTNKKTDSTTASKGKMPVVYNTEPAKELSKKEGIAGITNKQEQQDATGHCIQQSTKKTGAQDQTGNKAVEEGSTTKKQKYKHKRYKKRNGGDSNGGSNSKVEDEAPKTKHNATISGDFKKGG